MPRFIFSSTFWTRSVVVKCHRKAAVLRSTFVLGAKNLWIWMFTIYLWLIICSSKIGNAWWPLGMVIYRCFLRQKTRPMPSVATRPGHPNSSENSTWNSDNQSTKTIEVLRYKVIYNWENQHDTVLMTLSMPTKIAWLQGKKKLCNKSEQHQNKKNVYWIHLDTI